MVMKKIENKTAELVAVATIELLRPYKDLVLTITPQIEQNSLRTMKRWQKCWVVTNEVTPRAVTILLIHTPFGSVD